MPHKDKLFIEVISDADNNAICEIVVEYKNLGETTEEHFTLDQVAVKDLQ